MGGVRGRAKEAAEEERAKGNARLLAKLQKIADTPSVPPPYSLREKKASSQEINRRRRAEEIAKENMAFAKRLEGVKSATFDQKTMKHDQAMQVRYLKNVSQFPVIAKDSKPKPQKKSIPGRPPWFKELPVSQKVSARPEWQS